MQRKIGYIDLLLLEVNKWNCYDEGYTLGKGTSTILKILETFCNGPFGLLYTTYQYRVFIEMYYVFVGSNLIF